jgi:phosphatidylserine decarboxylase
MKKNYKKLFHIAKEGFVFILISMIAVQIFLFLNSKFFICFSLCATLFICWFFRDPEREKEFKDNEIASPADGKIIFAENVQDSPFYKGRCFKISIFMSVFNVHINRAALSGIIEDIKYYPGKFFSANLDKASKYNEHNAIFLKTNNGEKICMVQIAGLIARRIICYIKKGDKVNIGEKFGIICFGSRVDIYMPQDTIIKKKIGDKVKAGISVLGEIK